MSDLESLFDELGEGECQLLTEDRIRSLRDSNFRSDEEYSRPLDLEEALAFSESIREERDFGVAPAQFSSDEEFFDLCEDVSDWGMDAYDVDVLFGGNLSRDGYINTIYFVYDNLYGRGMRRQAHRNFEKHILEKFGTILSVYSEDNRGLCPFCSTSVEVEDVRNQEVVRSGENLIFRPDEIDFREYPNHGRTVRMWFDE